MMSRWKRIGMTLGMCVGALWADSAQHALLLAKRVPLREIVNDQGRPLNPRSIASPDRIISLGDVPFEGYGFIRGGKAFTPGWGGWVFNLETGDWKQEFPESLEEVSITRDGSKLYGRCKKSIPKEGFTIFGVDTNTGEHWDGGEMMHPDNHTWVEVGWGKTTNAWIEEVSIGGKQVPLKGKYLSSVDGFTDNGRYLIVDKRQLIDAKTLRILPVDPEMAEVEKKIDNYIGDSEAFVFNRDASWVAGGYKGGYAFIWNRTRKEFIWKSKPYSLPSAFSPNGTYLMCEGKVVQASTGEVAFKDLKGISGKFSPDGRSLVTVDDEAFYIYTLPKDSEPIFGVFQKPEPWSPPKRVKRTAPSTKKPLKNP